MIKNEVIQVASRFAGQQGYDSTQYHVRATKKDHQWEVYFQRRIEHKPSPGDFFTVYINDRSKSVQRMVVGK
jgi:hypothetical protein